MSTSNSKKAVYLGLGGLTVAVGGYLIYNQLNKSEDKGRLADRVVVDRATIIKVLKELKKEMFTVFQNFSAVSQNIKQQSMGRARPEDIKMMLLEQPMFRGEIDQAEDAVYSQFGITKEQVQYYCENVYREDKEIIELQKQMKESFEKSFSGIAPDSKTDLPPFLTPELTFQILERVMTESALKLNEKLLDLQEQGEQINIQNPKMMEIMQSLKMDNSKKDILKEYHLDQFEDPGAKILQYATQLYSQQNKDNFNDKMTRLDMKYQQIMETILMGGPMSNEELRQKMAASVNKPPGNPFAGVTTYSNQQEVEEESEPQNGRNAEDKSSDKSQDTEIIQHRESSEKQAEPAQPQHQEEPKHEQPHHEEPKHVEEHHEQPKHEEPQAQHHEEPKEHHNEQPQEHQHQQPQEHHEEHHEHH